MLRNGYKMPLHRSAADVPEYTTPLTLGKSVIAICHSPYAATVAGFTYRDVARQVLGYANGTASFE